MGTQSKLLIAMAFMVLLPMSVAAVTGIGLWTMEQKLDSVSEEYTEARMLQPIDADLSGAIVAIRQDDPGLLPIADQFLQDAKEKLVRYLATQYESVASEAHQAEESGHASALLERLDALVSLEWSEAPMTERIELAESVRSDLNTLYMDADQGVRSAQESALRTQRATLWLVIIASMASAAICISLSVWSGHSVNRRLREMHRNLASQSLSGQLTPPREIGGVVSQIEEMNLRMIEKIEESGRELLRRERMAGIGLLAADVAHEINNPMNAMLGLSELALKAVEGGPVDESARRELQESLRVVRREALRCRSIIERLMAMVRSDRKAHWFNTSRLLHETVQVARAARPDKAHCFIVNPDGAEMQVFAPPDDVRQILLTLLINAADAIDENGCVEIDATQTDHETWIRVRDDGRGFTASMKATFFTPFHSHREDGKGAGLGLSIAQALAEGMGASIRPISEGLGKGSLFVLAIPNAGIEQ